MSYHFEDITITKDSCIYVQNLKGYRQLHRFKLTEAGLDSLYAILHQNQFTQIEYRSACHVHGRGVKMITISWDNSRQRYAILDSQSSFVANEWKSKWGRICDYVKQLP